MRMQASCIAGGCWALVWLSMLNFSLAYSSHPESPTPFEQLEGRKFKLVVALVGFSTAILIFVWNSRRVVFRSDLPPRTLPGLMFPLYSHNYIQSPNGSQDETWHQGSGANGRRRRTLSHPLFELKLESRHRREIIYIEMKLGIQAELLNFVIDTGSDTTWVHCKRPGLKSNIKSLGPHGYFKPRNMEPMKCYGKDKNLCRKHQHYPHGEYRPCDTHHNLECLAWIDYGDGSKYRGTYYWESFTLPTSDKMEVTGQGVLGCMTDDTHGKGTGFACDGVIGLGVSKRTITSDWKKSKLITNRRIGICLGQAKSRQLLSSRIDVGYVTIGVNLQEKFGVNHLGWAELANTGRRLWRAMDAILNYIIFEGKTHYPPTSGVPLVLDTGAEVTRLGSWFYADFSKELNSHAKGKGYIDTESDLDFQVIDRRQCWTAPKGTTTSPIDDFPSITFCFKGDPDVINHNPTQCLVVQPRNYLEWKEDTLLLCSNILLTNYEIHTRGSGEDMEFKVFEEDSNLGRTQMRDYLIEVDPDHYRVRWQPDNCDF